MTSRDLSQAAWRKSSYSDANGGDCVEVATLPDAIALRDSKHPDGPALVVTPAAWQAFVTAVRTDAFPT